MALSDKERKELLELYADLRVADVRDGMDWMMRHHYGSMIPEIRPLWRTRAVGIAKTARYLPYQGEVPKMSPEAYTEWSGWYYGEVCTYPWIGDIQEGDFCVIDQSEVDAGLMGSNNSMDGLINGATGYVTNGGVRDTDEIIRQDIPTYYKQISQPIIPGRDEMEAAQVPVNLDGTRVDPGDVVVADGDGVVVVPLRVARQVGEAANRIQSEDQERRREYYERAGMEEDFTLE
jgi:regulator of RNase E activity RraA